MAGSGDFAWKAGEREGGNSFGAQGTVVAAVLVWAVAVSLASLSGLLRSVPPMVLGGTIVGWFGFCALVYFRSRELRSLAARIGLRRLTGFHVWRIAAAFLFFWYGAHGLLPAVFVERAAWGDLIAGILGGVVCLWPTRGGYWGAHLFGLADLAIAAATGMRLRLAGPPEMQNIGTFPVALIPLVGVGFTAAAHLAAFDLLLRGKAAGKGERP